MEHQHTEQIVQIRSTSHAESNLEPGKQTFPWGQWQWPPAQSQNGGFVFQPAINLDVGFNPWQNGVLAESRMKQGENPDGVVGRAGVGKARLNPAAARAALGNISNKTGTQQMDAGKKGLKDNVQKPVTRALSKSNATSSLQSAVDKENIRVTKIGKEKDIKAVEKPAKCEPVKPSSPAPMDISSNSQGEAFSKQMLPQHVQDIDKDDRDNPQLVSIYVNDIYQYLWELERKYPVRQRYLDGHEVNGRMRGILIDWLVQVHLRFHLLQETLYLTVAIVDRFLQEQEVSRRKLQLVGVTAMLIASKYEEMYAPEIGDFEYITDNAYSKADIRKMECLILKTLDFNLGRPLPLHFLRRNSKAGEVDATKHTLAKYLMELTITEYDMCHIPPSEIAAAALCLSCKVLDSSDWTDTLSHYSKYSREDLQPTVKQLSQLVLKAGTGKLTAIKTKYQSSKLLRIANMPELKSQVVKDLAGVSES